MAKLSVSKQQAELWLTTRWSQNKNMKKLETSARFSSKLKTQQIQHRQKS